MDGSVKAGKLLREAGVKFKIERGLSDFWFTMLTFDSISQAQKAMKLLGNKGTLSQGNSGRWGMRWFN